MRIRFDKPEEPFHPVTITLESHNEVRALLLRLHVPRHILKGYFAKADFGPIMACYPNAWEDDDPHAVQLFQLLVECLRNHPQRDSLLTPYDPANP